MLIVFVLLFCGKILSILIGLKTVENSRSYRPPLLSGDSCLFRLGKVCFLTSLSYVLAKVRSNPCFMPVLIFELNSYDCGF